MTTSLDEAVDSAWAALSAELPEPGILLLMGTGLGGLPGSLQGERRRSLDNVPGIPRIWREAQLVAGRFGGVDAWVLEDAPGDLEFGEGGAPHDPPWARTFPAWLAAAAGAQVCVVTAGCGSVSERVPCPSLVVVGDHLNLSGRTPLEGLGETRLGPLFPDQSTVLHAGLRERALQLAGERGINLREVVVAGTLGPALATPAERSWYRAAGADVFSQEFSAHVMTCAHAGLATLALLAVTDQDEEPLRMAELVARAEATAADLDDLIFSMQTDLGQLARELEEELA